MNRRPRIHVNVDLPSGRTLEVVHPVNGEPWARVKPVKDRDLEVCEACGCSLVQPTDWESAGPGSCRMSLWCPSCLHSSQGVFSEASADRFDFYLDDATASMVTDLKRLELANMYEDCERFIGALAAGAILPEDFGGDAR